MSDTNSNSEIDNLIKEFLFSSLSEEQLNNLRDELLNPNTSELCLKPIAEIKLFHQLFGLKNTTIQSI